MSRTLLRGFEVAGLRVAIEAPPTLPWRWPRGPLERFATSGSDADMVVGIRVAAPDPPPRDALRYDSSGGIFDVARDGSDWVIALRIRGELQRLARFDADFRSGEVTVHPGSFYAREAHYPLAYPLDEVLFLHRLAREGGLLVHACGVQRGRRALLFSGPSGAGKTTIARWMLAEPGNVVLSDDRIVIREASEGFRVFGTPWHGDAPLSSALSAPLAGIHLIHQAQRFSTQPLAGAGAAAALLGNAFLPAHDAEGAARVLGLAERIVAEVPVVRLGCRNERGIVPYVWKRAAPAPAAFAHA